MSDVEGVRNLIGTGLVEFAGGLLTAAIALVVLFKISATMTLMAFAFLVGFGVVLNKAFGTIRPIFRERAKLHAEVAGRLSESLGGVRVVKGYHAEEREEKTFAAGVQRLLDNVLKTLTSTSVMSLSSTVLLGIVGAVVMFVGTPQILAGTLTLGGFFTYTVFLGFLVAPIFQIVAIGTQLTEALAGLERTREILAEKPEDADPRRTTSARRDRGRPRVRGRPVRLRRGQGSPARGLVPRRARHGDGARRPVRLRQVHDHRPRRRVPRPDGRPRPRGRRRPLRPCGWTRTARRSASSCRRRSSSTGRSARTSRSRAPTPRRSRSSRPAGSRAWTSSPRASRRSTTRSSASAASSCPAASASASRSPGRSSRTRAS